MTMSHYSSSVVNECTGKVELSPANMAEEYRVTTPEMQLDRQTYREWLDRKIVEILLE